MRGGVLVGVVDGHVARAAQERAVLVAQHHRGRGWQIARERRGGFAPQRTRRCLHAVASGEISRCGGERGRRRSATRSRVSRPSPRRVFDRLPRSPRVTHRRPRHRGCQRKRNVGGRVPGVSQVPHSTVPCRPHATSVAGESQQDSQMVFMVCRRRVAGERSAEWSEGAKRSLADFHEKRKVTWPHVDRGWSHLSANAVCDSRKKRFSPFSPSSSSTWQKRTCSTAANSAAFPRDVDTHKHRKCKTFFHPPSL